ncbi:MAG: hypothetical protein RLP15_12685 [Cryomorphaceae bacterium]
MKLNPASTYFLLFAFVLAAAQLFYLSDDTWSLEKLEVITGDGRGYYDYLTSVFIDGDLFDQAVNGRYILDSNGRGVNKYYVGTSLLMLPFFLLGMAAAWLLGAPMDGFSMPFQLSMCAAAFAYAVGGVYFMRRFFATFSIRPPLIDVLSFTVVFGTNLLYYSAFDLTASHVYSFFTISALVYYVRHFFLSSRSEPLLCAAFWFGMTMLIRPVNVLVIFAFPLLAGDSPTFLKGIQSLRSRLGLLLTLAMIVVGLGLIQLILYKLQSGSWIVWSYSGEGFYFLDPAFLPFLFGFKRGWIVYSPLFLLLIPALWTLGSRSRWMLGWFLLFFAFSIYILSAWWSWHYGGSFGARPMIDFYSILLLPIGLWWDGLTKRNLNIALLAFAVLMSALTLVQVHQMKHGILSSWHMNAQKYFWAVGKLNPDKHAHLLGGRDDTMPYHEQSELLYSGTPKDADGHWNAKHRIPGKADAVFDADVEFSLGFRYAVEGHKVPNIFLNIELERTEFSPDAATDAFLVIEVLNPHGESTWYDAFRVNDHPGSEIGQPHSLRYAYSLKDKVHPEDVIKMYFWNKGKGSFEVTITSFELRQLH